MSTTLIMRAAIQLQAAAASFAADVEAGHVQQASSSAAAPRRPHANANAPRAYPFGQQQPYLGASRTAGAAGSVHGSAGGAPGGAGGKFGHGNVSASAKTDFVSMYNQHYGHESDAAPQPPKQAVVPPPPDYNDPAYAQWYYAHAAAYAAQQQATADASAASAVSSASTASAAASSTGIASSEGPPPLERGESAAGAASSPSASSSASSSSAAAAAAQPAKKSAMSFSLGAKTASASKTSADAASATSIASSGVDAASDEVAAAPIDVHTGVGSWQTVVVRKQPPPAEAANPNATVPVVSARTIHRIAADPLPLLQSLCHNPSTQSFSQFVCQVSHSLLIARVLLSSQNFKKRKIGARVDATSDDDEDASRDYLAAYGYSTLVARPKAAAADVGEDQADASGSSGGGGAAGIVAFKQRRPSAQSAVRKKTAVDGTGVSAE